VGRFAITAWSIFLSGLRGRLDVAFALTRFLRTATEPSPSFKQSVSSTLIALKLIVELATDEDESTARSQFPEKPSSRIQQPDEIRVHKVMDNRRARRMLLVMDAGQLTVWTVGHSARTSAEFLDLLTAYEIEAVADVRRYAASRTHPQFNQEALRDALSAIRVEYLALPELGGRRRPRPDSPNTAWRNESFRGYADYMETGEFSSGIERLLELARRRRTAVMCAEAVWWRCHRSLIADYLKARQVCVRHILGTDKSQIHPYTSAARITGGSLSYSSAD
jgi:hypothetical protein